MTTINQEYMHDKMGRLSKEDQLMMVDPSKDVKSLLPLEAPTEMAASSPQLSSTPVKHSYMTEEYMKTIEMPKPFQL